MKWAESFVLLSAVFFALASVFVTLSVFGAAADFPERRVLMWSFAIGALIISAFSGCGVAIYLLVKISKEGKSNE